KTKTASEIVKKALFINSKDAAMHTKLGDVYCRQDNYDEAENEYNAALSISPDYIRALSGLASAYEATDRVDEALEVMDRLEVVAPDEPSVKRLHAHVLLTANDVEKAGEKIQELYNKDPDDVHTLSLLGQYYICAGDEKKAMGCFKKIRATRPEYTNFYREAGKRHSQKGDYKKAEEFYQKFIDQNPHDTSGFKSLAKNYEAQGMLTQALSSYKAMEGFDSSNVASRKGLERVNNQILEERDKRQAARTVLDAEEFLDSDDDISIGDRVRVAEEVTLTFEDMDNPQPAFETEELAHEPEEVKTYNLDGGFDKLQDDEISTEEIFTEGRLDEEIEADNQEHYSKSLDDLIGDVDLDDEGSGLEEDNTSAEDFFASNPFGTSANKGSSLEENGFEPDFEYEQKKTPKKKSPKDDVISLDDGWDDDDLEPEEEPVHEPAPKLAAVARPKPSVPPVEPVEEPEKEEFLEDEDIDDTIQKEITEEPEVVPEPPEEDDFYGDDIFEEESSDIEEEMMPEDFNETEEDLDEVVMDEPPVDDTVADDLEVPPFDEIIDDLKADSSYVEDNSASDDTVDMELFAKAADAIQTVADAITENKVMKKTNVAADLFEKLRALSTYLPDEKREEFLMSKIRLQLDYIISKLSGNKGLLGTAQILRHQLGREDTASELDSGKTLLLKVLEYSKGLVRELPDASMVSSLNGQIENLISRI
ncbi:MAG: tetratricopeptide repeat protein, partial [Treponema sp.]|nr:tetratricopeptide repeat protein [Candidatus Treponema equi]